MSDIGGISVVCDFGYSYACGCFSAQVVMRASVCQGVAQATAVAGWGVGCVPSVTAATPVAVGSTV